jgi:hypothetical protein
MRASMTIARKLARGSFHTLRELGPSDQVNLTAGRLSGLGAIAASCRNAKPTTAKSLVSGCGQS